MELRIVRRINISSRVTQADRLDFPSRIRPIFLRGFEHERRPFVGVNRALFRSVTRLTGKKIQESVFDIADAFDNWSRFRSPCRMLLRSRIVSPEFGEPMKFVR